MTRSRFFSHLQNLRLPAMKKWKAMRHRQVICAAVSEPVKWQEIQILAPGDTC